MLLCSNLCGDIPFIATRILKRPDIHDKWFNANIKLIKRLCMMLVLTLMALISNYIFKVKYETHACGIEFETENNFKNLNEKKNQMLQYSTK